MARGILTRERRFRSFTAGHDKLIEGQDFLPFFIGLEDELGLRFRFCLLIGLGTGIRAAFDLVVVLSGVFRTVFVCGSAGSWPDAEMVTINPSRAANENHDQKNRTWRRDMAPFPPRRPKSNPTGNLRRFILIS